MIRNKTFDEFQKSTKIIKWNFLIDFIAFKITIERYVFCWFKIIEIISIDFKFSRNYHYIRERQFIIFFIFCHYLYSRKFSNFQFIFAFYLYHDDAKRRIIIFLYVLKLIISYKIFQNRLKKLTSNAQKKIKKIDKRFTIHLIYNNLNFAKNRRDERIKKTNFSFYYQYFIIWI